MAERKRESFIMFCNWEEFVEDLTDDDAGKLLKAIFEYVNRQTFPEFPKGSGLGIAFKSIKNQIDINQQKYEEKCEVNRQNAKKSHKRTVVNGSERKQTVANVDFRYPNDNDYDNDNDNDNEYDYDNEDDNDIALTENERDALVGLSSVESVEKYISKVVDWQKSTGKRMKNPYKTIKGWIEKDEANAPSSKPKPQQDNTSYDLTEFEKYAMGMSFGNGFQNAGGGRK